MNLVVPAVSIAIISPSVKSLVKVVLLPVSSGDPAVADTVPVA